VSLSAALKDKIVTVKAVNIEGGYQGKTTKLVFVSNSKDALQIKVDIGTVLVPDSGKYQPLILAGEEILALRPMGGGELTVQTFCGNSPKSCPAKNHSYSYAGIASDTLVNVLRFIQVHAIFDGLGQNAVWAITNTQDLSDIYDNTRLALSGELLDVVCKATGRPKPDYFRVNSPAAQIPGAPAYVPKPLKIIASFRIILESPKVMTLGVYNDKDEMIQQVFEDKEFQKSGHEFGVEFEAADVPAGNYYIRLKEGTTVLQEKKVRVD
jgi:hypothetical protein